MSTATGYRIFEIITADGQVCTLTVADHESPQAALAAQFPGGTLGPTLYEATSQPSTGGMWSGD